MEVKNKVRSISREILFWVTTLRVTLNDPSERKHQFDESLINGGDNALVAWNIACLSCFRSLGLVFSLVTICKIVLYFSRFFAFLLFKTCYASPNWVSYQLVLIDAHKRLEARFRHQSFVSNERQFWNTFQVVFLRFHPWKLVEFEFPNLIMQEPKLLKGKNKSKIPILFAWRFSYIFTLENNFQSCHPFSVFLWVNRRSWFRIETNFLKNLANSLEQWL